MKKVLPLLLTCFIFIEGCNDSNEASFGIEPVIEFGSVSFHDGNPYDSLILTILYKDGDSDLGLSFEDPVDLDSPYHSGSYFLENGLELKKVIPSSVSLNIDGYESDYPTIESPLDGNWKLVSRRTQTKLGFESLPDNDCAYLSHTLIIPESDKELIDESFQSVTEVYGHGKTWYAVNDQILFEENPDHYNIEVDFLVEQADGSFAEFDWNDRFCVNFDGRFPRIPFQRSGPFSSESHSVFEGRLTYRMASIGFIFLFGNKNLKLRVTIKDRALHSSNTIETPVFQLIE